MKKLVLILLTIFTMLSTSHAYSLKKTIGVNTLTTNINDGANVVIRYNDIKGYKFVRWETEGFELPNSVSKVQQFSMPGNDAEVEAILQLQEYSINYILDGGIVSIPNPTTYDIEDNITLNNPAKENYRFIGWTGTDMSVPTLEIKIKPGSTGNRNYIANWEEIPDVKYTVYHYLETVGSNGASYDKYLEETYYKKPNQTIRLSDNAKNTGDLEYATLAKTTTVALGDAESTTQIASDGSTKIYLYYRRKEYNLNLQCGDNIIAVSGSGKYKWGDWVEIDATLVDEQGYEFEQWSSNRPDLVANTNIKKTRIQIPNVHITLIANAKEK